MVNTLSSEQTELLSKVNTLDSPVVMKNVFDNVLSIEQFENLLNLTPFTSVQRFSPTFDTPEYTWSVPDWSSGTNHWPNSLVDHLINNGICYMRDCSRVNPSVNNICKILEQTTNRPVDAHIYFSKSENDNKGFGIHKDDSHNLIIQVQGKTDWKVGTKSYKGIPGNIDKFLDDDTLTINEVLEPGDVIFVPAHIYHSARSLSKRISISFPIPEETDTFCFEERTWINWNA